MPLADHVTIVAVDDDDGHLELVRRSLRRSGIANPMVPLRSGEEALAFLRRTGRHANLPPHGALLVLLDINMPGGLDGIEVLRRLKSDPELDAIPVMMLTTTDDPREVSRCHDLGCSAYFTKPFVPAQLIATVEKLGLFAETVR